MYVWLTLCSEEIIRARRQEFTSIKQASKNASKQGLNLNVLLVIVPLMVLLLSANNTHAHNSLITPGSLILLVHCSGVGVVVCISAQCHYCFPTTTNKKGQFLRKSQTVNSKCVVC